MKKYLSILTITSFILPSFAQAQILTSGYTKKPDIRLNEQLIRKSVMDYSTQDEIAAGLALCKHDNSTCEDALHAAATGNDAIAERAMAELAFLKFNEGQYAKALEYITKAQSINAEDPFLQLSKAWFLLANGKYKESIKATEELNYLTADFEYTSEAVLIHAISAYNLKDKKAQDKFAFMYTSNPYLISLAAYLVARMSYEIGNERNLKAAEIFAQQAVTHDDHNFPAAKILAQIKEKQKDLNTAWQYYAMLYAKDPSDKEIEKKLQKIYKKDSKNKTLMISRLDLPLVKIYAHYSGPEVKMGLYANSAKQPVNLNGFQVISTHVLTIVDEKLGEVYKIPEGTSQHIDFDAANNSLVIKDRWGNVKFATKRAVNIIPEPNRTLLVKEIKSGNMFEADFSDKELKGSLWVYPSEYGMMLVNHVGAEELLPSLLTSTVRKITQEEAFKAFAIAVRTKLYTLPEYENRKFNFTDNEDEIAFVGVNMENRAVKNAALDTKGLIITESEGAFYSSCGAVGENTISNAQGFKADINFTPVNSFKYLISNMPVGLYAEPKDDTEWAPVKWAYLYEAKDIERRVKQFKNIGTLKNIFITQTTEDGRVERLVFKGSKAEYDVLDFDTMSYILGATSTRSDFFRIIPIHKGKKLKEVLIMGVNTGKAQGLCVQAAQGMAKQGKTHEEILKHYYPSSNLLNTNPKVIEAVEEQKEETPEEENINEEEIQLQQQPQQEQEIQ
ncbi:SpoIID/LytB domain protein [Elusimicrobium posterum]|uniref:SpoIID/LytB domain-containing protein n=1 Tax=Elusimicrobium posterum TaxID=3116653 RepID=UPI003C7889DE